ncbi:MAG TPA: M28 family peptidase [Blastocatellia bacterium]|nr:M28 family peptidase [Blastocatellia bacterium]
MFQRRTTAPGMLLAVALAFLPVAMFGGAELFSAGASDKYPLSAQGAAELDAARSYEHVKKLVEIGPRPPGSEAIKKAQEYIGNELKSYGLKVIEDDFQAQTTRGTVGMKNIIGELSGQRSEIVLIAGHYDTKLQRGFVGANDGGSSTAAVLEMARVLAKTRPEYTVWFVFFDGEEAFVDWSANNGMDNTYGSRHMASKLTGDGTLRRVKAMVLVDMIGDKNLDLLRDDESTPWMVNAIWKTARELGQTKHFLEAEGGYSDDHIPFKGAGVPVVDLIDFNYGPSNQYWHTNEDTLDKISGESIKIVGDVVIASLPEIFKQLNARSGKH